MICPCRALQVLDLSQQGYLGLNIASPGQLLRSYNPILIDSFDLIGGRRKPSAPIVKYKHPANHEREHLYIGRPHDELERN